MPESEPLTLAPLRGDAALDGVVTRGRPAAGRSRASRRSASSLRCGAAAWALMVIVTDHSFGLAAAGLGILAGELDASG